MKINKKASGPKEMWNRILHSAKTRNFIKNSWRVSDKKDLDKSFKKIVKNVSKKKSKK